MASLHRLASADTIPNPVTCTSRLVRHSSLPNLFLGEPELLSPKSLSMAASAFLSFPSSRSKVSLCRALSAQNFDELSLPAANACRLFSLPIGTCDTGHPVPGIQQSSRKEALMAVGKQVSFNAQQSIVYTELKESMGKFEAPPRFLRSCDSKARPSSATPTYIHTHIHESSEPVTHPNLCMESSPVGAKGMPLSLRMLKRKLSCGAPQADRSINLCRHSDRSKQHKGEICPSQEERLPDARSQIFSGAQDSVSSAFASLFYILKMLQQHTHALRIWCQPSMFGSDRGCFESLVGRACAEMLDSFLWIFQQVFSCTPELMLLTMVLLADFTLHAMSMHVAVSVPCLQKLPTQLHGKESAMLRKSGEELMHGTRIGADENWRNARKEAFGESDTEDVHAASVSLYSNVHEKRRKFASGLKEVAFDVPMKLLVAPVRAPTLEADDYPCFDRTDLTYQHEIGRDPRNPLLLANYAHFLHLVRHDYGRAEQLYKRAMNVEAGVDGDVVGRFASFLWVAKGDVAAADKAFRVATMADPTNAYHAGNYAHFLWNTSTGQA